MDGGEVSTTTDANGDYAFPDLAPGTYTVVEEPQTGWQLTAPVAQRQLQQIAPTETVAANYGHLASVSADGRYIAFRSTTPNLVPGDTGSIADIFVLDRDTASLERVSVHTDGTPGNAASDDPAISADGRYVAYRSWASNLVDGDTNGTYDIFLRDRTLNQTRRISVDAGGNQANSYSYESYFSADSRFVVFWSNATNLVTGDTNARIDTFVYEIATGAVERVSLHTDGTQGNNHSYGGALSADGNLVVFESAASSLVGGDTNNAGDIFLRDRAAGTTTRVSVASGGTQANGASSKRWLSGDGRYVVFSSAATNLVPDDTNAATDIFLRDLLTGQTRRISVATDGTQADAASDYPQISSDGRYVVFESLATNLVDQPTGGYRNVYRYDRVDGVVQLLSAAADESAPNGDSYRPFISSDGLTVTFHSGASNLVAGDTNGQNDVFVADLNQYLTSGRHIVTLSAGQTRADLDFGNHDIAPPTVSLTFPSNGGIYNASGWTDAVTGTAADTGGAGLDVVEVSLRRGTGNYWDGDGFDSATEVFLAASGTADWSLAFADANFPADGSYTVRARAIDLAGNVTKSPDAVFQYDTTPPATGTVTAPDVDAGGAGQTSYQFTIQFTDNVAIDVATLDGNDVTVTGPNSFSQNADVRLGGPGRQRDAADGHVSDHASGRQLGRRGHRDVHDRAERRPGVGHGGQRRAGGCVAGHVRRGHSHAGGDLGRRDAHDHRHRSGRHGQPSDRRARRHECGHHRCHASSSPPRPRAGRSATTTRR